MSTHTDGAASPSVGGSDDADGEGAVGAPVFGPDATPPRQRDPSAGPPGPAPPDGSGRRNGNGHAAGPSGEPGDSGWVQQEIQRRIAARGVGETGRHSRSDRAPTSPGEDPRSETPGGDTPPPRSVATPAGPPRRRSTRVPDPYAPDGMRDLDDLPEGPFRMPGPAAASPEPRAPRADAPATPPKQWPPADGAAGLPRRVPGAGWTLGRRAPGDASGETAADADDAEPETRLVPALWSVGQTGSRGTDVVAPAVDDGDGPHRLDDDLDDDDLDDDDLDDDDLDDLAPTGLTGDTEVIWRAPGLDEPPVPAPPTIDGGPAPNPYTGVRPRRFAGATTDVAPEPDVLEDDPGDCPDLDGAPQGRRKRVVLSERRTIAQSVRTVVDVQDPGPVGKLWRDRLISTQLRIALQVGGVALLWLFLMPALFAAFPAIGDVSVFGIRLPWLLLGFLTYPFLLGLGWWYVASTERSEQDFIQEVQDR